MKGLKFSTVVAQVIIIPYQKYRACCTNGEEVHHPSTLFVAQSFDGI